MGEGKLVPYHPSQWIMPAGKNVVENSDDLYADIDTKIDAEIADEARAEAHAKAMKAKAVIAPPPQIAGNGPIAAKWDDGLAPLVAEGPKAKRTMTISAKPELTNVQYRKVFFTGSNGRERDTGADIAVVKAGSDETKAGNILYGEGFSRTPIRLKNGTLIYVKRTDSAEKIYLQMAVEKGLISIS